MQPLGGIARPASVPHKLLALTTVAALAIPSPVSARLSVGGLLLLAFLPVAVGRILESTTAKRALLALLCLPLAYLATLLVSLVLNSDRRFVSANLVIELAALYTCISSFVAAYWAATVSGVRASAVVVGASAAVAAYVFLTPDQAANGWKYAYAWPVSLLVVALLSRFPLVVGLVATAALSAYSLLHESRNAAGALAVAGVLAVILTWHRRRRPSGRKLAAVAVAAVAATGAVFLLMTSLISAGVFGAVLQERGNRQDAVWLVGARIEPFAVLGYFLRSPLGIGPGVSPSPQDRQAGLESLVSFGAQQTAYVDERLLGDRVDPHSVLGTFWLNGGILGLAAGVFLMVLFVGGILVVRRDILIIAFVGVQATWDALFSPLISNGRWFGIALALVLVASVPLENELDAVQPDGQR